jgi:cell division protein FtsZ
MGAGSDIKIGEQAAQESKDEIKHLISDAQLVFITCGLGGGTGTGSVSVIAHEAKGNRRTDNWNCYIAIFQ